MFVIVSYDIPDNRRRLRLHTLLQGYGAAVQRSVFACDITAAQLARLVERATRIVDPACDDLRVHPLCARCHAAATHIGPNPTGEQPRLLVL